MPKSEPKSVRWLTPAQMTASKNLRDELQAMLETGSEEQKHNVQAYIDKMDTSLKHAKANLKNLQKRMQELQESDDLKKILSTERKGSYCGVDTSTMKARSEYLVQQTIESKNVNEMQRQMKILVKYDKDTTALKSCIDKCNKEKLQKIMETAGSLPTVALGIDGSSSGSDGDDEDGDDEDGDDEEGGEAEGRTLEVDDAKDDQKQSVDGHCAEDPAVEVIAIDNPDDFAENGLSVAFFIRDKNGEEHSFTLRPKTWGGLDLKPSIFMFKSTKLELPVSQTLSDMLGDLKARIGLESSLKYETLQSMLWRCPYFKHMKCMFVSSSSYPEGQLKKDFIEEQKAFFETVVFKLEFVWECILSLCDPRPTDLNECKKMLQAKVAEIENEKEKNRLKVNERKQKKDGKNQDEKKQGGKKKRKSQEHSQPPSSGKDMMSDSSVIRTKARKKSKKSTGRRYKVVSSDSGSSV